MASKEEGEDLSLTLGIVSQSHLTSIPPGTTKWLREQYLDPSVRISTLGFLWVGLGGSMVYSQSDQSYPQIFGEDRDWDGIGIVQSKGDIIKIINQRKADLCKLMRITSEEDPSLYIPDGQSQGYWDVLRFSGRTLQGSKRTIKIWSADHLYQIAATRALSTFGVLSFKVCRLMQRQYPPRKPWLLAYQPMKITDRLSILYDFDFDEVVNSKSSSFRTFYPGVSCDLFLSSMCMFERSPGTTAALKGVLLTKWQSICGADKVHDLIPLLSRATRFSTCYTQQLRGEFIDAAGRASSTLMGGEDLVQTALHTTKIEGERGRVVMGHDFLLFAPLSLQTLQHQFHISEKPSELQESIAVDYEIRQTSNLPQTTPFSSNSTGSYAEIRLSLTDPWQEVYMKRASTVSAELNALQVARQYFPSENLQSVLASSTDCIFYKRLDCKTLNDLRLRCHLNREAPFSTRQDDECFLEEWFLNIELHRAHDVLAAYMKSFTFDNISPTYDQHIHSFFYHRIEPNCRLQASYGHSSPAFLQTRSGDRIGFEAFIDLPVVINGKKFKPLRHYLDRASEILNPTSGQGLKTLPVAFGLGDGHGGNVLIPRNHDRSSLSYIDYEVAGFHTPFLDLAKPIYHDSFFEISYADLLCDDLTQNAEASDVQVQWNLEKTAFTVDYTIRLDFLSKCLAVTKLEYLLRPMLEMLDGSAPALHKKAEETLSYGLLACALLARNYSKRPDVFALNLALGIRLATEIREVLSEVFEWRRWPSQ